MSGFWLPAGPTGRRRLPGRRALGQGGTRAGAARGAAGRARAATGNAGEGRNAGDARRAKNVGVRWASVTHFPLSFPLPLSPLSRPTPFSSNNAVAPRHCCRPGTCACRHAKEEALSSGTEQSRAPRRRGAASHMDFFSLLLFFLSSLRPFARGPPAFPLSSCAPAPAVRGGARHWRRPRRLLAAARVSPRSLFREFPSAGTRKKGG